MISDVDKTLSRLQNLCARKEYCSSEMYRKALMELDGDEQAAADMVAMLVRDKYVDDSRYAGAFCRDKAHLEGWGPIKISWMLKGKGIDAKIISGALDTVDEARAESKLRSILEAKSRMLKGDENFKLKLIKFALSRGYEYDRVSALVNQLTSNG